MQPLIIQIISGLLLYTVFRLKNVAYPFQKAGLYSMSVLFFVAGVGHFFLTKPMVDMMPEIIPFREAIVIGSGVFEIACSLVMAFTGEKYRNLVVKILLGFLVISLPINIYSAVVGVGLGAHGLNYLWFRVPLQMFWFWCLWYFGLKHSEEISS